MADETHLKIIKQGAEAWNQWREGNQQKIHELSGADHIEASYVEANLDLSGADLRGADLTKADLSYTNLSHTDLREADLRGADLYRADLFGADLFVADLSGAKLSKAKLSRANLASAKLNSSNLNGAQLVNADLQHAHLCYADLREALLHDARLGQAKLSGADLRGAYLFGADLSGADLRRAKLNRAKLAHVNFSRAELSRADLGEAVAFMTIFAGIDLSNVNGLESVAHEGPSLVGVDTLSRCGWLLPEEFLRKSGFSEWQIEAAKLHRPDLMNEEMGNLLYRIYDLRAQQPVQVSPLFISYSHADRAFVDSLEQRLVRAGIRFWRDVHHASAGRLETQIDRAIRLNPTVLLILSESAVSSD